MKFSFDDLDYNNLEGDGWTEFHRKNYNFQVEALRSEQVMEAIKEAGIATSEGGRACLIVMCGRHADGPEQEDWIGVKAVPNAEWEGIKSTVKDVMLGCIPNASDDDEWDFTSLAEAWLWVEPNEVLTVSAGPHPSSGYMVNVFSREETPNAER